MRLGIIILMFSVALAGEGQGPAPSGDKPIKCGWGFHPPARLPRIASPLARPTRDMSFISLTGAFAVHYDTAGVHSPNLTDSDQDGTPDWVEAVAVALDSSRNLLLALGFDPAPDDGDGVYDVYLKEYNGGTYGNTDPDGYDSQGRLTSYITVDNDFAEDENYYTYGLDGARVTVAHEYFHAVQMGYKAVTGDLFFYELASTWFEDVAFPEIDDWVLWFQGGTGSFGRNPTQSLAGTDGYSVAIFGHYLTEWYGLNFMLHLWERFQSQGALAALRAELLFQGGSLSGVWIDFVAGLFLNGAENDYHFYPDQILLDPPVIDPPWILSDSLTLSFPSLRDATASIQSLQMSGPSNLRLEVRSAPEPFTARLVLDSDGLTPYNLTDASLFLSRLNSLSKMVVVVGAQSGDLDLIATVIDTSYNIEFALDELIPNPVLPGRSSFTGLQLTYRVGEPSLATRHRLAIFNLLGQEVYRRDWVRDVGEGTHTLMEDIPAMRHWASGVYLLTLSIGRHTLKRTFTVIQ
ncbi:MAG: hypothetical protein IIA60_00485 [Candidatus Marinimicrobia bacterium]|nr:hypothetical protein [Candidatus Neomarinimicrobiota bacterium]